MRAREGRGRQKTEWKFKKELLPGFMLTLGQCSVSPFGRFLIAQDIRPTAATYLSFYVPRKQEKEPGIW